MKNHYISLILFCLLLLAISCKKEKPAVSEVPPAISFSLSEDTVYSGSSRKIAVDIAFENLDQLKQLLIKKRTSKLENFKAVQREEIGSSYTFSYTIGDFEEDQFAFEFTGVDINGKTYQTKALFVDTRIGVLPHNLKRIARVTGKGISSESIPGPNKTDEKYDVGRRDLGIMWAMENGNIGLFFGDTFGWEFKPSPGGGPNGGNWRSNVLAFSNDQDLTDGLTFSGMAMNQNQAGSARQIIHSDHITNGTGSHTAIPTAAIRANGVDFVHYMDIRQWGVAGGWSTNFSELYRSTDNGQNWIRCPEVRFASNSNFSQVSYAKKDGFVYMLGTRSGRFNAAFLARFREHHILNQSEYEYWNESAGWVKNAESQASAVFNSPVGELSLIYHEKYKRWIATYLNENKAEIVLRDAADITGPWSTEKTLVSAKDFGGLYGAFIHPLKNDGEDLYFLMSMWQPYNVYLMKSGIKLIE